MHGLITRFETTRNDLSRLVEDAQRNPDEITLLAVSKTRPADDILQLYRLGQRDFGENYLQEALAKQDRLGHLAIRWHFIGPIQSNKTRLIANRFHWVHTLDRSKIAQRLNDQRHPKLPPLNCCIQLNLDDETTKSGIALSELPDLTQSVLEQPNLRLRGLMAIPSPTPDVTLQREKFEQITQAMQRMNDKFKLQMDTLSMGMSGDLGAAIQAGSTMVRIGTAIFGPRPSNAQG